MNRTSVEEIKARLPIEEVIGSYVKLDKAGKSYKARCPFHNEKSASFFVSPDRGGYYCFGCNAKGDIFTFVQQFEGLDFKGALKVLADRAGIPIVYDTKSDSERDVLLKVMEEAAKYFESEYEKDANAKKYVASRGISPETKKSFRIGWAPIGWKNLYNHLKGKGWKDDILERAGLVKKKEGGVDLYDRFRGRIIFPITDSSGRVIAFTGRILVDDGKSAKYLNSPDSPLFNKSQVLFGLDKAKSEIRRLGYSILVEGQMDLVLSHQSGVKNVVAASGTALTDEAMGKDGIISNLGMVKRLSANMIIALDSDAAGKTATMRAVASTALQMGMSVKIAVIEGGKDPADLILSDPQSWKEVLKNSNHVIEFELDNVIKDSKDSHTLPKAIRDRVFPFLARIESEMDKAVYVKMISEKTGLSENAVWEDLRKTEKTIKLDTKNTKDIYSKNNTSQNSIREASTEKVSMIEKRLFGLLALMRERKYQKEDSFTEKINGILGDKKDGVIKSMNTIKSEILFEAEQFYGSDESKWDRHMNELILNYEEDMVNEELVDTMRLLREAEKSNESEKTAVCAKKFQELSIKKAEIKKKRKGS